MNKIEYLLSYKIKQEKVTNSPAKIMSIDAPNVETLKVFKAAFTTIIYEVRENI